MIAPLTYSSKTKNAAFVTIYVLHTPLAGINTPVAVAKRTKVHTRGSLQCRACHLSHYSSNCLGRAAATEPYTGVHICSTIRLIIRSCRSATQGRRGRLCSERSRRGGPEYKAPRQRAARHTCGPCLSPCFCCCWRASRRCPAGRPVQMRPPTWDAGARPTPGASLRRRLQRGQPLQV